MRRMTAGADPLLCLSLAACAPAARQRACPGARSVRNGQVLL